MESTYFEIVKTRYIMAADRTNCCARDNDVNRNHTNYGVVTTWAQVLRDMGHEADVPVWEDNGLLKIPYISLDGEKIVEFHDMK